MATPLDEITEEVTQLTSGTIRAEVAERLCELVLDACRPDGVGDPTSKQKEVRDIGKDFCVKVVSYFRSCEWLLPAKSLLLKLWDQYAELQRTRNQRVYRALISQLLTQVLHDAEERGEAFRWSLLTQADDILGEHSQGGGHGKHWLYGIFGLSVVEQGRIKAIAEKCRAEANKSGWKQPAGFAEEVIRRLIQEKSGRAIVQRHALVDEFHITPAFLGSLLRRLKAARTKDEKGKRLEDVAFYLFSMIPGCVPRRNLRDRAGASEYDVVVNNLAADVSLAESLFGRDFLVESKNWAKRVGVQEVGYFLLRMGLTHCRFGVIFASNGITEKKKGDAYARALIRRAFHEHGASCIVLDLTDLERLASGAVPTFMGLMTERLIEFRFGK